MTLIVVCLRVWWEKTWSMFEGRAEQVVLISLLSTGDARGINSLHVLCVCWLVVKDVHVAATVCASIYFELRCLIVGETFFQPTQLSGLLLNGEVKVMLITMCSLRVCSRVTAFGKGRIWETSSEPCWAGTHEVTHAYVGCPDGSWSCSWGMAGDRERVWPMFDVLADVETGAFGSVLAL